MVTPIATWLCEQPGLRSLLKSHCNLQLHHITLPEGGGHSTTQTMPVLTLASEIHPLHGFSCLRPPILITTDSASPPFHQGGWAGPVGPVGGVTGSGEMRWDPHICLQRAVALGVGCGWTWSLLGMVVDEVLLDGGRGLSWVRVGVVSLGGCCLCGDG